MTNTPQPLTARPYQERLINQVSAALNTITSVLAAMPTGAGKTFTFAEICRRILVRGRQVAIIVHRQELIEQSANAVFNQTGVAPGIVWGKKRQWDRPIVIISHGTIQREQPPNWFKPILLILDEAHHAAADGWKRAVDVVGADYLIGFTATPFRQDREPLFPEPFEQIIRPVTPQELIDLGVLCPATIESPMVTDAATGLPLPPNRAANLPSIYLKAVQHALGQGREKIIVFVSGTQDKSPMHIIDESVILLNSRGITAGAIREGMSSNARREAVKRYRAATGASALISYMALTEGFDASETDCVVIGRTTKSESTIIQMIGRGLRQHPGKLDCLVINYTGRP